MSKIESSVLETGPSAQAYEPPTLGDAVPLVLVTLFSGAINPDAGVVTFGNG